MVGHKNLRLVDTNGYIFSSTSNWTTKTGVPSTACHDEAGTHGPEKEN